MNLPINPSDDRQKNLLEWIKLYIQALIDHLKPSGAVLEVGFWNGISSDRIQTYHTKTHTIIEENPQLADQAKTWASKYPNTTVLQGKWEDLLATQGKFDAIFFNDYPVEERMKLINFLFPEDFLTTSNQIHDLLIDIEKQMSKNTKQFTDQEIDDFYQRVGRFNLNELLKFFQKLKENGNITKIQFENLLKKFHIDQNEKSDEPKITDYMLNFLEECIKNHMEKESRFTCFLNLQLSKYQDSQFFEKVITNPEIEYTETTVPIKLLDKTFEALLVLVEKSS